MQTTRVSTVLAAAACLLAGSAQAQAQAPRDASTTARSLAANCAACHGTNGKATAGGSRLAGLDNSYIVSRMQAFKSGQLPATVMHQIAKGYSDADIEMLAAYFAAQR